MGGQRARRWETYTHPNASDAAAFQSLVSLLIIKKVYLVSSARVRERTPDKCPMRKPGLDNIMAHSIIQCSMDGRLQSCTFIYSLQYVVVVYVCIMLYHNSTAT